MERILITGAKGFVGKALIKLLSTKEYELITVGDSKTQNLCDRSVVSKIPKVDVIIHLAARSYIPDSFKNPFDFYTNNITTTLNILEKAKQDDAKVILLSTYVYGSPKYLPIDEEHIKKPLNPYTQSKLICEDLCEAYNRDFEVPVTIFRPFNIYGTNQGLSFFIPTIIAQLQNKEIHLNDSRPKRDFIYIDDVVNAIEMAIKREQNSFNIYNLGTGVSTSIKEVVNKIINLSQSKAKVVFSEQIRQGEILDTVADIAKIKNELGWQPKIFIDEGISSCVKYLKAN